MTSSTSIQRGGASPDEEKKRLQRVVRVQAKELNDRKKKLKQGAAREKKTEFKILKIELEVLRQREELLHVTRVGKLAEFVSSLAHEISQPLTAIRSYTQAAQRMLGNREPNIQDILRHINNDSHRAAMTIQRLRSLLKKGKPEVKIIDVSALIQETIELVSADTIVRSVSLKTDVDTRLPYVQGDRIQLQQVLLNLISNSFEAMEGNVRARHMLMSAFHKNSQVVVSVKDSGCGIPEKNMPKLFSHFFTSKPDGLGMGLAISRSIVEAHGGRLTGENNSDVGATFSFTLPVEQATP